CRQRMGVLVGQRDRRRLWVAHRLIDDNRRDLVAAESRRPVSSRRRLLEAHLHRGVADALHGPKGLLGGVGNPVVAGVEVHRLGVACLSERQGLLGLLQVLREETLARRGNRLWSLCGWRRLRRRGGLYLWRLGFTLRLLLHRL